MHLYAAMCQAEGFQGFLGHGKYTCNEWKGSSQGLIRVQVQQKQHILWTPTLHNASKKYLLRIISNIWPKSIYCMSV